MWVRSDDTLPTSRKMGALIRALGWTTRGTSAIDEAMGIVHRLWYAVMQERPDGVLDDWTPEDVAFKLGRSAGADAAQGRLGLGESVSGMAVVDALMSAGFLAANEDGVLFVPGWYDRNGHRAKDLARYKAKVPHGTPADSGGIPRTPAENRPTRRDVTRRTKDAAAPRCSASATRPEPQDGGKQAVLRVSRAEARNPDAEHARDEIARLTRSLASKAASPEWADAVAEAGRAAGASAAQVRTAMQVCARLRQRGVTTPAVLGGIAGHYFANLGRVGNPFAYYTSGGTAVGVLAKVLAMTMQVDEARAAELANVAFLKGGAS